MQEREKHDTLFKELDTLPTCVLQERPFLTEIQNLKKNPQKQNPKQPVPKKPKKPLNQSKNKIYSSKIPPSNIGLKTTFSLNC